MMNSQIWMEWYSREGKTWKDTVVLDLRPLNLRTLEVWEIFVSLLKLNSPQNFLTLTKTRRQNQPTNNTSSELTVKTELYTTGSLKVQGKLIAYVVKNPFSLICM